MLKYFICPEGNQVSVEGCLKRCPRGGTLGPRGEVKSRCLSLPSLVAIASVRPWRGKPSTTQLLNGVRYSYLQIVKDYAIDPKDHAFALLGTRHHQMLDVVAKKLEMVAEKKLDGEVTGILDLLEPDELLAEESFKLIDYKTWGSYKVAQSLGVSGRQDMWESELQLNHYRVKVEPLGFRISEMLVQATVRDGGTDTARGRNVFSNIYLIPVRRLDDKAVLKYFERKRIALLEALDKNILPERCSRRESWNGRRCEGFCEVVEWCPEGLELKQKKGNKGNGTSAPFFVAPKQWGEFTEEFSEGLKRATGMKRD